MMYQNFVDLQPWLRCKQFLMLILFNTADPFSMAPQKALESIGKTLSSQYERWQPKVGMIN